MTAEERFARLIEEFAHLPGVEVPSGSGGRHFGSEALKVNGSIFAMVTGGQLVVKLPADRVRAMVESGTGGPFGAAKNKGPMKEWAAVLDDDPDTSVALAREALEFVGKRSKDR